MNTAEYLARVGYDVLLTRLGGPTVTIEDEQHATA